MFFRRRKRMIEKILLYRQLGMMLASGMSFETALTHVEETGFSALRRPIARLKNAMTGGASLAETLGQHPLLFDPFAFDLLVSDQNAQPLGRAFQIAADQLEESATMFQRVMRVFWYPALTLCMGLMVLLLLCTYVLPSFARMFADFGGALPLPTQVFLEFGRQLGHVGPYALLLLLALVVLLRSKRGLLMGVGGKLPLFGGLIQKMQGYLFARHLAELLKAQLPLETAVRFCACALHYGPLGKKLCAESLPVSSPAGLRTLLEKSGVYPKMVQQMISSASDDQAVAEVMTHTAGYFAAETERAQYRALIVTEITTLLLLGFFVGGGVIAMYLPIFKIAGTVGG